MSNVFDPQHVPTVSRSDYFPSLVYDCSIVEVTDILFKTYYILLPFDVTQYNVLCFSVV